ncbi:DUF4258 domain-containing protein [Lentiprolixibacter aurantiacus]|uniref:DUF4258 domain-containing protein n=1 Tax=Lentiprolixibacter aurantiacus TaxID=2993939 RepID=A0AAE3MLS2_9FLAO|nr:DUF4258 domain-containing protein [Lentiprolixibacter aurantiacus]MCX2719528.1 DUF4258 domain-containing protein [Lentiprolixibacter aurantiacus]
MSFLKRLGFYLIGLSVGLIFLVFFLKKKSEETGTSFCYLPNCRVIKELRSKPQEFSPEFLAAFNTSSIDSIQIDTFLSAGDVDFKNSDTKSEPCKTYKVRGIMGDDEMESVLIIDNCPDVVIIQGLYVPNPD